MNSKIEYLISNMITYRMKCLNRQEINMMHVSCIILKNKPHFFTPNCINKSRLRYHCQGVRSIHSEIEAISKLPPRDKQSKKKEIDLIVIRITKSGMLTSSMPCQYCLNNMNKMDNGYKINNIYFSKNDRTIEKVKLRDLMIHYPKHISGGFLFNSRKKNSEELDILIS
jgi:cytidine deaminase